MLEEAYEAFVQRADLSVLYKMLAPEVEWRAWNDEGNCHDRDEVMEVIRAALDRGVAVEVPAFLDAGGDKLVLIPREMPPFFPPEAEGLFQVWEIRDGKVVAMRDFIRRADALAAAGVS